MTLFEILRLFKVHPAVPLKRLRNVSVSNKDTVTECERCRKKSMFKGNEISKMLVNNNMLKIRDALC